MSQKKILKPKIIVSDAVKNPTEKEVIITIPVANSPPVNIQQPVIRTLVPEHPSPSSEKKEKEKLQINRVDAPIEPQDDESSDKEEAAPKTTKRKQRTKKVYPPSDEMFDELIKSMCELREITRKVITLTRETQKATRKEMKELNATIKKDKSEKPVRKPRGFALPSPVSDEMVDYLINYAKITQIDRKNADQSTYPVKIEKGCLLARNELTSALCTHFKNSLMRKNELDKRDIHLDARTTQLFGIDVKTFTENGGRLSTNGEPIITYFDLQKYLPKHCGKQAKGH